MRTLGDHAGDPVEVRDSRRRAAVRKLLRFVQGTALCSSSRRRQTWAFGAGPGVERWSSLERDDRYSDELRRTKNGQAELDLEVT